ncbi:histone-lysine N-methyltransferase SETMAR-like [Camponotus floridanus]|uniref:histone-lysine N-methyltransferase SETMAR-like n=1 Tax=Camponotus floridanus TaxID=104421 RepID=UPI000DC69872|nr:histone-lysine N-methyltransferase SETMAR-like [Camponotus floridanus]
MESEKQHFRHILFFYYRKGKNAVQVRKKLSDVYGEDILTERQCQNWFAKFRPGNFDVEDVPRSGRPVEADEDTIKALIDANRRITTREIAERLNLSNSTVHDHLKRLGLISKLDIWVPHVHTERNLCRRVDVCDLVLKRQENNPFLERIITGDEKWVVYNNVKRKRSWTKKDEPAQSTSKADIHKKKVMLSISWDFKGIVFLSFYRTTTINSEVYCHQLDKLNDSLKQKRSKLIKRKGIVFHQDNARPHTSLVTRQKLLQLGWYILPHPPYSPDLAPSDYYLFRSLQNFLDGKKTFTSNEEVKNHLDQFFASKEQKFYERGIILLPERWQKVLDQNGQYII